MQLCGNIGFREHRFVGQAIPFVLRLRKTKGTRGPVRAGPAYQQIHRPVLK